jgi:hypothetical protein
MMQKRSKKRGRQGKVRKITTTITKGIMIVTTAQRERERGNFGRARR